MATRDLPARGVAMMIAAQAVFGLTDALQKFLMDSVPVMLVVWSRYCVFALIFLPLVLRQPAHLTVVADRGLLLLRGCALLGATCFMAWALARLPLATATTLMFVGPFIVTAMSALVLKEQVGWRRWSAIAVGFLGMLIVVRPGADSASVGWAALLVVGSTFCWSMGVIVTRRIAGRTDAMTMLVWQTLVGLVGAAPFAWGAWVTPDARAVLLLLANGGLNLAGQWLTIRALHFAPVATLAPLTYTLIVWATLLGWTVFGTLPDGWTLAGAVVIIASGLYVWWRERVRARATAADKR